MDSLIRLIGIRDGSGDPLAKLNLMPRRIDLLANSTGDQLILGILMPLIH